MGKRKIIMAWMCGLLLSMLAACSSPQPALTTSGQVANTPANVTGVGTRAASTPTAVAKAAAQKSKTHDDPADYVWDKSQVTRIALNGNSITVNGTGATADGSKARITVPGTYDLSGTLTDGQIIVNTTGKGTVRLILNGVDIRNSTSAPIYVMSADKTVIVLADNTRNSVADGKSYVQAANEDEPNAAIFSKGDLTIYGNGSLTVNGNYNDGIASKDGLIITSGTITINSVDDGIRGKDYLVVQSGNITVTAKGDGLKSDNADDATKGYILVEDGMLAITSGGDAIEAETDVTIKKGKITISSGGGSKSRIGADQSAKGIKAGVSVVIDSGTFAIDSADDALHSNKNLVINGGTFVISSGDDAMHADATLTVNSGDIRVQTCYEGLESAVITINGGNIAINSSDDGLNVVAGNDGSGFNPGPGRGGFPGGVQPPGGMRGQGGVPGMQPGQESFAMSGNYYLYINGGYVVIQAAGDGIDINGNIEMTNGVVIVNGPVDNMNGALDFNSFKITGGLLVAVGSSGMAQVPGESSTQNSVLVNLTSAQRAGTLVHIRSSDGKEILTFSPTKQYQSIAFSSPDLAKGSAYDVYLGGSSTGTVKDNLYQGGTYTAGTKYTSFTASSVSTRIGTGSRFR